MFPIPAPSPSNFRLRKVIGDGKGFSSEQGGLANLKLQEASHSRGIRTY